MDLQYPMAGLKEAVQAYIEERNNKKQQRSRDRAKTMEGFGEMQDVKVHTATHARTHARPVPQFTLPGVT